jgi:hypothetical protein
LTEIGLSDVAKNAARNPYAHENEAAFGRPGTSRGTAGYPQLRLVVLWCCVLTCSRA